MKIIRYRLCILLASTLLLTTALQEPTVATDDDTDGPQCNSNCRLSYNSTGYYVQECVDDEGNCFGECCTEFDGELCPWGKRPVKKAGGGWECEEGEPLIVGNCSDDPVRYLDGAATEFHTDLFLKGPMISCSIERSYNSRHPSRVGPLGFGWQLNGESRLVDVNGDGSIIDLLESAGNRVTFTLNSTTGLYESAAESRLECEHDTTEHEFRITSPYSDLMLIFFDFSPNNHIVERSRLKEVTTKQLCMENENGVCCDYNTTNGRMLEVMTACSQACSVTFAYNSLGLIEKATISDGTCDLREVAYTYEGDVTSGSDDLGSFIDLVQVIQRTRDSADSAWIERITQYRYYTTTPGLLKAVYEPAAIESIIASVPGVTDADDILGEDDEDVEDYASRRFEYYGTGEGDTDSIDTASATGENLHRYVDDPANKTPIGWVKSETVRSSSGATGCCGSGSNGGLTRYDFYYIDANSSSTAEDPNEVKHVVVVDKVTDTTLELRSVFGLDSKGFTVRTAKIVSPSSSPMYWCTSQTLNSDYRVVEERTPAAHDVTSDADAKKFLDPYEPGTTSWTNDTDTLHTNAGQITITTYNGDGFVDSTQVKQGSGCTAYYTWGAVYGSGSPGSPKNRPVTVYSYPTQVTTKSSGQATTYSYTVYDNENDRIKTIAVAQPAIPTSQNGSGVATSTSQYYDEQGLLRWKVDGEGYITYFSYDPLSSLLSYTVLDADPNNLPSDADDGTTAPRWLPPSSATSNKPTRDSSLPTAIQMVSTNEFDGQGRKIKTTLPHAGSIGSLETYTVFETDCKIIVSNWDGTQTLTPVLVIKRDVAGRTSEQFTVDPSKVASTSGVPTGLQTITSADYHSWTKYTFDAESGGQLYTDRYHDIAGNGFYRTAAIGDIVNRKQTSLQMISGTTASANVQVTQNIYDQLGRVVEIRRSVASSVDISNTQTKASDITVPSTTLVGRRIYDNGGVGDGFLTSQITQYATGTTDNTGSKLYYTYRGQLRGTAPIYGYNPGNGTSTPQGPYVVQDVDWMGNTTAIGLFSSEPTWTDFTDEYTAYADATAANRIQLTVNSYDDQLRIYRSERFAINESTGAKGNRIQSEIYRDRNGKIVAAFTIGSAKSETAYDGVGRAYQTRTSIDGTTPSYSSGVFQYDDPQPKSSLASMSGGADKLVAIQQSEYDAHGNEIASHLLEVNHDEIDTGIDLDSGDENYIRRTIYRAFDAANRVVIIGDYGSGGTNWGYYAIPAFPTSVPTSSSSVHVSFMSYAASGFVDETIDPSGKKSKHFHDDLGRRLYVVENFNDFDPSGPSNMGGSTAAETADGEDIVVGREYDGFDNLTKLTAYNVSGTTVTNQVTEYEYGDITNASLVTKTTYPDGDAGTGDNVTQTYYLDGSPKTKTDQRGTTIETTYVITAGARRPELQKVTALGGDTDGTVRSIKRAYDANFGRVTSVQSFASTDGTGTPLNEVAYEYDNNLHGKATVSKQSHSGAWTSGDPEVTYAYDETNDGSDRFDEGFRATSITYPSGKTVECEYTGTANGALNWISKIKSDVNSGSLFDVATYERSGSGTLVEIEYPGPAITHAYDEANDGTYEHRDRFGHTLGHGWKKGSGYLDRHDYTYDLAGNRLTRSVDNTVNSSDSLDETFTYDSADRLDTFTEGTTLQRDWELDSLGNWESYSGTSSQTRTHNVANELSAISTWQNPVHDAAGNMTEMPIYTDPANSKYAVKYDAWNRPVEFNLVGTNLLIKYQYDGLNRRISKTATSGVITFWKHHFYYSQQWQVLETVSTTGSTDLLLEQQVWHPYYVDALAVRTYDGGSGLVTHYALQDANFNMVALTDTSGNVTERYDYTPYGELKVLDADFSSDADGVSDVANPYTYTGRRYDSDTGLYYYRNRYYYAQLGRFCSRDPIGYADGPNLYRYLWSVTHLDPYGTQFTYNIHWRSVASLRSEFGDFILGYTTPPDIMTRGDVTAKKFKNADGKFCAKLESTVSFDLHVDVYLPADLPGEFYTERGSSDAVDHEIRRLEAWQRGYDALLAPFDKAHPRCEQCYCKEADRDEYWAALSVTATLSVIQARTRFGTYAYGQQAKIGEEISRQRPLVDGLYDGYFNPHKVENPGTINLTDCPPR